MLDMRMWGHGDMRTRGDVGGGQEGEWDVELGYEIWDMGVVDMGTQR